MAASAALAEIFAAGTGEQDHRASGPCVVIRAAS
jgi:hypothetical protein